MVEGLMCGIAFRNFDYISNIIRAGGETYGMNNYAVYTRANVVNNLGCVARNILRRGEIFDDVCKAVIPNRVSTNLACPIASLLSNLFICPFLIMCIASMPSNVRSAVWRER